MVTNSNNACINTNGTNECIGTSGNNAYININGTNECINTNGTSECISVTEAEVFNMGSMFVLNFFKLLFSHKDFEDHFLSSKGFDDFFTKWP